MRKTKNKRSIGLALLFAAAALILFTCTTCRIEILFAATGPRASYDPAPMMRPTPEYLLNYWR